MKLTIVSLGAIVLLPLAAGCSRVTPAEGTRSTASDPVNATDVLFTVRGENGRAPQNFDPHQDQIQADSHNTPWPDPPNWLAPPTNLRFAGNPRDCEEHMPAAALILGGDLACDAVLSHGGRILLWDWPSPPPSRPVTDLGRPDGYRIYVSSAGSPPSYWDAQAGGYEWTLRGFLDASPPDACYTVRAYQGPYESYPSNPVCGSGDAPLQHFSLPPAKTASFCAWDGELATDGCQDGYGPGGNVVGYRDRFKSNQWPIPDAWRWEDHNTAVWFDLSPLRGRVLHAAYLIATQAVPSDSNLNPADSTCVGAVADAAEPWMNGEVAGKLVNVGDDFFVFPPTWSVPTESIDAMAPLYWMLSGGRDFGFVFKPAHEGYAQTNDHCLSWIDSRLEVDVY